MAIKLILLILFLGGMVLIGCRSKKHAGSVDGFLLGGRNVGAWLTAFAYGTSYFSAVIFVGYAGQFGYKFGVASTWIGLGNAFIGSLLAWLVLGRRTRLLTQKLDSATMPDFFGKRFGSQGLRVASALIVFVFLIPYTASLFNGLSRLFTMAFHVDYAVLIVVMAALTCVYVVAGGYHATAVTDFIQGMIMLVGIAAIVVAVLQKNGGFLGSLAALSHISDPETSTMPGVFASFFGPDPLGLASIVILTSLGTWGLPQMVQKFYAIRDERAILKGTVISTLFALVVAGGCYFLGGFGRLFLTKAEVVAQGYDAVVPTMMGTLSDLLIGLVIILVLSASMSTLSSLVLASSSTLTMDLLNLRGRLSDKRKVLLMRVFVVVFVAISAAIAIVQYKSGVTFIAQLMGVSWGALAGAFLAPFLFGLYWKRTSVVSVWASFAFSVLLMSGNVLFPSVYPTWLRSPINCGTVTMLVSLVLVPLVSLVTKAPDAALVDGMFSCYDETVLVPAKLALHADRD